MPLASLPKRRAATLPVQCQSTVTTDISSSPCAPRSDTRQNQARSNSVRLRAATESDVTLKTDLLCSPIAVGLCEVCKQWRRMLLRPL